MNKTITDVLNARPDTIKEKIPAVSANCANLIDWNKTKVAAIGDYIVTYHEALPENHIVYGLAAVWDWYEKVDGQWIWKMSTPVAPPQIT